MTGLNNFAVRYLIYIHIYICTDTQTQTHTHITVYTGFTVYILSSLFVLAARTDMIEFWKAHSREATVEEMMLDSQAHKLTQCELPEILSILPGLSDSNILELGAGIGWDVCTIRCLFTY